MSTTKSARSTFVVMAALTLLVGTLPAAAHHSIAGQFDMTKTVRLSGVVKRLDWVNPHVYLFLEAANADHRGVVWKLETLPVAMLRKAGIKKQMLMTGETVELDICPARNGTEHLGFILNMKFPDGKRFQFSRDPNGTVTAAPLVIVNNRTSRASMKDVFDKRSLLRKWITIASIYSVTMLASAAQTHQTPRLADGKPDLNGTWDNGGGIDFVKPTKSADGSICVRDCGVPPPPRAAPDRPKYKPQYEAKVKELAANQVKLDPGLRCGPPGVPRIGPPDKIVQTNREVVFLYEDITGAAFRVVALGGKHIEAEIEESDFGHSIGYWDADTLVVDTVGFNADTWLTDNGAFHTTKLHVIERLKRVGNTIEFDVIVEDPEVFAEPWQLRHRTLLLSDSELPPPVPCHEQDLSHVVDGTHHDNLR